MRMETEAKRPCWTFVPPAACFSLEGGKGLEEFGQVDVRVAAGRQGFVGDFLQPAVRLFLSFPALHTTWKRRERKQASAALTACLQRLALLRMTSSFPSSEARHTNQKSIYQTGISKIFGGGPPPHRRKAPIGEGICSSWIILQRSTESAHRSDCGWLVLLPSAPSNPS